MENATTVMVKGKCTNGKEKKLNANYLSYDSVFCGSIGYWHQKSPAG